MKSVAVVVGLFAMLAVHATAGQDIAEFKRAMVKCKSKTGASDAVIKSIKPMQVPETHEGQCYLGCLNRELGLVFPNNKLNVEKNKAMLAGLKEKNPDMYQKSVKVAEICATKITENSDDCDAAKIISQCFVDEGKKIGMML